MTSNTLTPCTETAIQGATAYNRITGKSMLKLLFDFVIAWLGLMILLPAIFAITVIVRLGSPGPVLFRQIRVGRGGRDFVLLKFRTMTSRSGSEKGDFDAGDGSRVTKFGRFLRATKLDELPQLWNVIRGDMALVGPRPEVRKWVEVNPERWAIVHEVRPGITDPAAIVYRDEEKILANVAEPELFYREQILPRKLDLYVEYVKARTFWGDVKILGRTGIALVTGAPADLQASSRRDVGIAEENEQRVEQQKR